MSVGHIRAIAFLLPQFHPIPENDEWWGKGFTEWTNVTKARPLFEGHYQPHLPADLGFYDLRLPEAREAQATLAREYGVYGFCYYHYWFNGHRILERPINEVLSSGKPDFPFCLCWANENWSRRWDGRNGEVLLAQTYSPEDDIAHIRALKQYFDDPRYIRLSDKPLMLIYRASNLPDPVGTVARWRAEAKKLGLPGIHLCNVESLPIDRGMTVTAGFDAAVEFAPDWSGFKDGLHRSTSWRIACKLRLANPAYLENHVSNYADIMRYMLTKLPVDYLQYPCVTPSWDNAARRQRGATILTGSTPDLYGQWLREIVKRTRERPAEQQLVFINAWNEWAEGNHLEPCIRWGRHYLDETRSALNAE
jgi:lipopolysaccharide biosynthesis protein